MQTRSLERINEQARIGIKLLKEAILEYLVTQPGGAFSAQMAKDLGLDSEVDTKGKHSDKLLWGLHNLLVEDGKVRIDRESTPHRWLLTSNGSNCVLTTDEEG